MIILNLSPVVKVTVTPKRYATLRNPKRRFINPDARFVLFVNLGRFDYETFYCKRSLYANRNQFYRLSLLEILETRKASAILDVGQTGDN